MSYELSLKIHKATRDFPKEERYGLSFELRKTSRSLWCNIADGHKRRNTEEYIRFLNIAQASGAELETLLLLSRDLNLLSEELTVGFFSLYGEVKQMLGGLVTVLEKKIRGRL